jgi:hypothetical protein
MFWKKTTEFFENNPYRKWLVVWDCEDFEVVLEAAEKFEIEVKFMKDFINEMIEKLKVLGSRDDILRTIELISQASKEEKSWAKYFDKEFKRKIPFKLKCQYCGYQNRIYVRETYERKETEVKPTPILVSISHAYCKKCTKEVAKEGEIFRDRLNGNLIKKRGIYENKTQNEV